MAACFRVYNHNYIPTTTLYESYAGLYIVFVNNLIHPEADDKKDYTYRYVILTILTAAQVFMAMATYVWGPLAPFLVNEFGVNRLQLGYLTSFLYLASIVIAIPSGLWVDRYGARLILIVCLLAMGIPFMVIPLGKSFLMILILATLSGLGYGMINQVSTKGIMYWFSTRTRATAMGIKQIGVNIGGAIIAVLLPVLGTAYNWRVGVLAVGLLILIMVIFTFLFYRERPAELLAAVASSPVPKPKASQKNTLRQIMAHPIIRIVCLVTPLMAFAQVSITSFLVLYLGETFGFSKIFAGSFLTVFMIAGAFGRIGWGIVSDRVFTGDRVKPMVILTALAFLSTLCLTFFSENISIWLLYVLVALMGITFMGWNTLLITLVAEIAGAALVGSIMGILITFIWIGIVIGPPAFGAVTDNYGYFWSWLILAIFGAINMLAFAYMACRMQKKE